MLRGPQAPPAYSWFHYEEINMPAILSQVEGFVGTITLNHPEKRNALSEHLVDGIIAALEDF